MWKLLPKLQSQSWLHLPEFVFIFLVYLVITTFIAWSWVANTIDGSYRAWGHSLNLIVRWLCGFPIGIIELWRNSSCCVLWMRLLMVVMVLVLRWRRSLCIIVGISWWVRLAWSRIWFSWRWRSWLWLSSKVIASPWIIKASCSSACANIYCFVRVSSKQFKVTELWRRFWRRHNTQTTVEEDTKRKKEERTEKYLN